MLNIGIIILILFFIALVYFSYKTFSGDIIHPVVVFSCMYLVSVLSVAYNLKKWYVDLAPTTLFLLITGALEFFLVGYLFKKYYEKKNIQIPQENREIVEPSKVFVYLIIIYDLIIVGLTIVNVLDIASRFGEFNSLSQALYLFKEHTSYNNDASLPHYLSLLYKVTEISSYIYLFFFFRSFIDRMKDYKILENLKENYLYLLPSVLFIVKEFLCSSRITIIQLVCAALFLFFICWNKSQQWAKRFPLKKIIVLCLIGVIGLAAFYASASLIGRKNENKFLDYITLYCGGSIECFDHYIQTPYPSDDSDVIGNETFYLLIQGTDKYGITHTDIATKQTVHLPFRYTTDGVMIGNVYTAYRRWHHDFGLLGMYLLNGIQAAVLIGAYYFFKYHKYSNKTNILMIMVSYIYYSVFLHCVDSYFYTTIFQITTLVNLIIMIVMYLVIVSFRIEDKSLYIGNKKLL